MAVTIKDPAPAQEQAKTSQEEIAIELAAYKRYITGRKLFEKGVVYVFPADEAKRYLRVRDDRGRPVFSRYEEELEVQQVAKVVRAPSKPVSIDEDTVVRTDSTEDQKPTRLDVGDDAELEKDGILPPADKGEEAPL